MSSVTEERTSSKGSTQDNRDAEDRRFQAQEDQQRNQQGGLLTDDFYAALPQAPSSSLESQTAWTAYFDLADQTLRTARRVSEGMFINSLRREIVQEVRSAVLAEVRGEIHQAQMQRREIHI